MTLDATACLNKVNCDACPLGQQLRKRQEFRPVPAELNDADLIVVGDSSDKTAVDSGVAFSGPLGVKITEMLAKLGRSRHDVAWTNVIACRFPSDDTERFYAGLQKRNKRRLARGDTPLLRPEQCCKPRLTAELQNYDNVIALGSIAFKTLGVKRDTGEINLQPSLAAFRGAPVYTPNGKKLIGTRGDIKGNPMWAPVVQEDFARMFRYMEGTLTWREPEIIYTPTPEQLETFISISVIAGSPRLNSRA